jgi:hypothetical protein
MTKIFLRFMCIAMLVRSGLGFAQAPAVSGQTTGVWTEANPRAFCEHDPRPEISAYCKDLADVQTAVNKEKKNPSPDLAVTNQALVNPLSKMNIADKRATVDFITATASRFALNAAIADAIRTAGQQRLDQQLGATPSASGTTSLLSKAGSAELVSLALDAGVLTRSINGTTATLSMNADQLFRLVTGADPTCIVTTQTCKNESWFETRVAGPTTISASMDLAQQSTTTTATSGQASGSTPTPVDSAAIPTGAGKLSGITARYEIRNGFDPRSAQFHSAWASQVTSLAANVKIIGDDTDAVSNLLALHPKFAVPEDADPFAQTKDLLHSAAQDSTGRALLKAFEDYWSAMVTDEIWHDSKLAAAVSKATQDRNIYRQAWFAALNRAVGTLLTVEYDFNRLTNQPQTHDLKIIYAHDFGVRGMVTVNGAVSFYSVLPAGARYGRLHYGQISTQYDRTLSGKDRPLQTQLSLAGYWQYQPNPSILDIPDGTVAPGTNIPLPNGTQEFVGTAGSLWVTQAKLTIKGSGGINVPIGVSWSNKTDLLQGSRIGAQIGLSYNFSSFANMFSGSSGQ